jgi:hypothetical protein
MSLEGDVIQIAGLCSTICRASAQIPRKSAVQVAQTSQNTEPSTPPSPSEPRATWPPSLASRFFFLLRIKQPKLGRSPARRLVLRSALDCEQPIDLVDGIQLVNEIETTHKCFSIRPGESATEVRINAVTQQFRVNEWF